MTTYHGDAGGKVLIIDGSKKKLLPRAEQVGLYPSAAFDWGNRGMSQGEARLAIAILRHALGNDQDAIKLYQRFKYRSVVEFPKGKPWSLTKERVLEIVEDIRGVERESSSAVAAVAREAAPRASEGGAGIVWDKTNET